MTMMRYGEAIDYALGQAMAADDRILTWGEDARLTRRDLFVRFGADRVLDTPISEAAFLYAGVGAAMGGLRPVVEFIMVDFAAVAWSGIANAAAKFPDFAAGGWDIPLVLRAGCGGWYSDGGQHQQVFWGQLAAYPNVKVVCPSDPADAAGLMLSALADDGFVVYLEHQLLSEVYLDYLAGADRETVDFGSVVPAAGAMGDVPTPAVPVPLGKARVRRQGSDVVLVSAGVGVHRCLEAAARLTQDGVDASVLDLRSISPLDRAAIDEQARRNGRVVVVDEDYLRGGLSGEIAASLLESGLHVPFARVAVETTIPFAPHLEFAALPNPDRIVASVRRLVQNGG
jgi:pyruvate/2-oxoglutarate/acetoin dehydrogenase E1 component